MLSSTAFGILTSLRDALLCPHPGCGVILRKPVSLPCGHNLCAECATVAIDDEDGCSVCEKPCWGKDARTNHHMARVIEHVTSLMDLSEKARTLQGEIVRLEAAVSLEKAKDKQGLDRNTLFGKKRQRQQSPHVARVTSSEEAAAFLVVSLSPAAVQTTANPPSQASERKYRSEQGQHSPAAPLVTPKSQISSPLRRNTIQEVTEINNNTPDTPKSPKSTRKASECPPTPIGSAKLLNNVPPTPTRSVGRNGGGQGEEKLINQSILKESPKKTTPSAGLKKRLAASAVDASQSSEIEATGSSQQAFIVNAGKSAIVNRGSEVIDESNTSWSQRLSANVPKRVLEAEVEIIEIDHVDSSQSDGPVIKRPKIKANSGGQSQHLVEDGSPSSKTLLSVAKASGFESKLRKPLSQGGGRTLNKAVVTSLGHLSAPTSRSGLGTLPLVAGSSTLSAKTLQQHKQKLPPATHGVIVPLESVSFSSRFGQGGAERARRTGKIVLMPSSLSEEEREELKRLVTMLGSRIASIHTKDFDPQIVTHLIVPCVKTSDGILPDKRLCTRTIKYASAVLCGCWVLDIEWVRKCLATKALVNEEDFEAFSDKLVLDPTVSSPLLGRESARSGKKPMLSGRSIYIKEPLCKLSRSELVIALQCAGATILKSDPLEEKATESKRPISEAAPLVITSYDLTIGASGSAIDNERIAYSVAAKRVGLSVVDQLWFLDSISRWKLEDEGRYTLEGICVKSLRKSR